MNRTDVVKNINRWEWFGLLVRIDYTRILKQVLNGAFKKDALLEYNGPDGKIVRRRKRLSQYRNIRKQTSEEARVRLRDFVSLKKKSKFV